MLDIAKHILKYGVSPEAETQLDVVELDSDQESLSFAEQRKILAVSPSSQKKQTYQVFDGKKLVRLRD